MPEMGAVLAPYLPPPPPGSAPPSNWGDEDTAAQLLSPRGIVPLQASRHEVLVFDDAEATVGFLVRTAGHVLQEQARLENEERWGALLSDMTALVLQRDQGDSDRVELALEYLLFVGRRT